MPEEGDSLLHLHYLSGSTLDAPPPEGVWLGGACFGACRCRAGTDAPPLAHMQLTPLMINDTPVIECMEAWAVSGPVRQGHHDELTWRCNDSWWFGVIQLDEFSLRDVSGSDTLLQKATRHAYGLLFEAMAAQGFANLVRIWNHIADITVDSDGLERYRQFNIGRQDIFLAHGRRLEGKSVPAASALGAASHAPLVLYALASRRPVKAIENPRQVSAYCYPSDYGPRSPTFSRAALALSGHRQPLFISGTASIVGHRSLHAGDVVEQTRETLRNLQAILDQAGAETSGLTLSKLTYKVYVRHEADWPKVHWELCRAVGGQPQVLALKADICRNDLLVEIEAVGFGLAVRTPVSICTNAT